MNADSGELAGAQDGAPNHVHGRAIAVSKDATAEETVALHTMLDDVLTPKSVERYVQVLGLSIALGDIADAVITPEAGFDPVAVGPDVQQWRHIDAIGVTLGCIGLVSHGDGEVSGEREILLADAGTLEKS